MSEAFKSAAQTRAAESGIAKACAWIEANMPARHADPTIAVIQGCILSLATSLSASPPHEVALRQALHTLERVAGKVYGQPIYDEVRESIALARRALTPPKETP